MGSGPGRFGEADPCGVAGGTDMLECVRGRRGPGICCCCKPRSAGDRDAEGDDLGWYVAKETIDSTGSCTPEIS